MLIENLIPEYKYWGSKWRAQLLGAILGFSILFTLGPVVAQLVQDPSVSPQLNFLFLILILEILIWVAWRLRGLNFAANLFAFGSWLAVLLAMLYSGGISGPLAFPLFYVVIIAALITPKGTTLVIVALSALSCLAVLWLETSGMLPASLFDASLIDRASTQIAIIVLAAATILYANQIQRRLTQQVSENERTFRALFEKSTDAVFLINPQLRLIEVNAAGADLLGYAPEEMVGLPIQRLFPVDEWQEVRERLRTVSANEILSTTQRRFMTRTGDIVILETNLAMVTNRAGQVMHYQSIGRDITATVLEEQRMRSTLAHMTMRANTDALTGLLNREAIMQHAHAEWERYTREGVPMSIMMVDMDGLKKINDTHGHLVGDAALKAVAKMLENNKRPYDWLGRLGGDEFMLVLPGAAKDAAETILARMRAAANAKTIHSGMDQIALSSSMGIASTEDEQRAPRTINELVERADQALYAAKRGVQSTVT